MYINHCLLCLIRISVFFYVFKNVEVTNGGGGGGGDGKCVLTCMGHKLNGYL